MRKTPRDAKRWRSIAAGFGDQKTGARDWRRNAWRIMDASRGEGPRGFWPLDGKPGSTPQGPDGAANGWLRKKRQALAPCGSLGRVGRKPIGLKQLIFARNARGVAERQGLRARDVEFIQASESGARRGVKAGFLGKPTLLVGV